MDVCFCVLLFLFVANIVIEEYPQIVSSLRLC